MQQVVAPLTSLCSNCVAGWLSKTSFLALASDVICNLPLNSSVAALQPVCVDKAAYGADICNEEVLAVLGRDLTGAPVILVDRIAQECMVGPLGGCWGSGVGVQSAWVLAFIALYAD